jgi:hypothetical protein
VSRRVTLHKAVVWLCIAFAAVLALAVEWMTMKVVAGGGGRRDWFALSLFIVPLLISLGAIALILSRRPVWVRWAAAATILVLPPVLLLGAFHG